VCTGGGRTTGAQVELTRYYSLRVVPKHGFQDEELKLSWLSITDSKSPHFKERVAFPGFPHLGPLDLDADDRDWCDQDGTSRGGEEEEEGEEERDSVRVRRNNFTCYWI